MNLGSGHPLKRKQKDGLNMVQWQPNDQSRLRMQLLPWSYIERETIATIMFDGFRQKEVDNAEGTEEIS